MITIQQMQYILALTEERQFQRASERCFVTQPTLSMQLKKAEQTLGGVLFDRSASPLELTPFGEQLVPIIRNVLNEYDQIQVTVERSKGMYKERLRLGVIPTVATYLVPRLFDQWKELIPDVQLSIEELKTEDLLQELELRKIDMGVLAGPVGDPRLRSHVLYQEEIMAFLPEGKQDEVTTEDLKDYHPWLLTQGNCLRTQMVHFCNLNKEEDEQWSYEGGNMGLLERMVESHGGYTLVPEFSIDRNDRAYKRIRSATGEVPAREIISLSPNRSSKWPIIEKIIRSIQLEFASGRAEEFQLLSWK